MNEKYYVISGQHNAKAVAGKRLESRLIEEAIQKAVADGYRRIQINAVGQHGLGGRIWRAGNDPVSIVIEGQAGQRVGAMGFPQTTIHVMGPASDDVGWLNGGAEIVVHGHASNGVGNAMAQGKIYIAGNIGSRGMTMTKHNPRFSPPELWVLGSAGDYFGEFMAGGIAVICGVNPQNPDNVLGYRPLVGMVGGSVFFRGQYSGFSESDAKLDRITDDQWHWLEENLILFSQKIGKPELGKFFMDRSQWLLIRAKTPLERRERPGLSVSMFRRKVWEQELGSGGLIGGLTTVDRSLIPVITTGDLRRYVPVWENRVYNPPCESCCPTGIPVHQRWQLIREGRIDEAVDLALNYTPFPATVCGYLCPNLCMQGCTRESFQLPAVDVTILGKASLKARPPKLPELSEGRVAVIGGGPAGISAAWRLRQLGHEAVIYDMADTLGGKIASVIPEHRIPAEVLAAELNRIKETISAVKLGTQLTLQDLEQLKQEFDYLIISTGAHTPRILNVPGKERLITSLDFLRQAKIGAIKPGKRVVIIGAGNVGCDAAVEARRLGAEQALLIDVQEPASFGKERKAAEAVGAQFRWPCFTRAITAEGVELNTGELIPADTVIISIGDTPALDFLPKTVHKERGYIVVDEFFQTSDDKLFAVGDVVKPGLLTDSIGAGRKAAEKIHRILTQMPEDKSPVRHVIDRKRIKTTYFDPRLAAFDELTETAAQCASCGICRDCGLCVEICPVSAISKKILPDEQYQYIVNEVRCIGCGFCMNTCPCGVWNLTENEEL